MSPGSDRRNTEFDRSGLPPVPTALPLATRTELLSTTGPGGAQTAAARAAGTWKVVRLPPPSARAPIT